MLFTDVNLPDGIALARRARKLVPRLPVVYASAGAAMLDAKAVVPGGIIVPKPYAPALVASLLAHAALTLRLKRVPAQAGY